MKKILVIVTVLAAVSLAGCAIIVPYPYYPYHGHHEYYRYYR